MSEDALMSHQQQVCTFYLGMVGCCVEVHGVQEVIRYLEMTACRGLRPWWRA